MTKNFEDILNSAIAELKKGTPKDEVLLLWPEYKEQLLSYLEIATQLSALPKNRVPKPVMRRKYAANQVKTHVWFAWLHFSRFVGVSMAALLLLAGSSVTAYKVLQSLPGQPLFSLKKSIEQVQLQFATSDAAKANLQMDITKKRLAEAQAVFNSPASSPEEQVAALNELNNQTSATLQTVKSTADNQSASPLAASLQAISQQQQALLNKIQSSSGKLASNDNSPQASAVQQLKQMVAATNEQANVIALAPNPNAVTMTGPIDQINRDFLTIANTSFAIDQNTVVKDDNGNIIKTFPQVAQQVTVIGIKGDTPGKLTAAQILLQPTQTAAATSDPASTLATSSTTTSSAASLKKPTDSVKPVSGTSTPAVDNSTDQPLPAPSQASTGFIPEDPSPQFTP